MLESIDIDKLARVTGGAMGMEMQPEVGPGQAQPGYPVQNQNGILRPQTNENAASGRGNMPLIGPDFDPARNTRQVGV